MRKIATILLLHCLTLTATGQAPTIQWQKCLGGNANDVASYSEQTTDGGYIVSGVTASTNGDVAGKHGSGNDFWIVKLNNSGAIQWQKILGGSDVDQCHSIRQTADGGYIAVGYTESNDGDVTGNHGKGDCWIIKLNSTGDIQWQKTMGGSKFDNTMSVQQTFDGGYIIGAYSWSNDGDVSAHHGSALSSDYWIVKLSPSGSIQWQKSLGGSGYDHVLCIKQTYEGGYIVAGTTQSNDGDVVGNHGSWDYWIVKLSESGGIEWQKCLGGTAYDVATSVLQTFGGYIVAGTSYSNDGDVTGHHDAAPGGDMWVIKLSASGNIIWQKSLGGNSNEECYSIEQTIGGGYIVTGHSSSIDGDATGNHGNSDCWIVKLSGIGSIEWQQSLGGSMNDRAVSAKQTTDGGYIVAGTTESHNGDVAGNHGHSDYWIAKLSGTTSVNTVSTTTISIHPNPTTGTISVTGISDATIRVYNTIGQMIASVSQASEISVAAFPAGMYFVRVFDQDGVLMKHEKIIKNP